MSRIARASIVAALSLAWLARFRTVVVAIALVLIATRIERRTMRRIVAR